MRLKCSALLVIIVFPLCIVIAAIKVSLHPISFPFNTFAYNFPAKILVRNQLFLD